MSFSIDGHGLSVFKRCERKREEDVTDRLIENNTISRYGVIVIRNIISSPTVNLVSIYAELGLSIKQKERLLDLITTSKLSEPEKKKIIKLIDNSRLKKYYKKP